MRDDSDFTVSLDDAVSPLVLGIDVGSTGSRAGLYDARGVPVAGLRHKERHAFTTAGDGTATIDADQVAAEVARCLDEITHTLPPGAVAGVGIDTFASSLVAATAAGEALTPCFTYADSRCAPQVAELLTEFDLEALHDQTGTRLHTSYLAPRLRWLRESDPEVFAAADRWLSLGEYVQLRLTGTTAAGTSTGAWSGLLDRRSGTWVPELLDAAGVRPEQFSPLLDPDRAVPDADAGERWPALRDAAWFAPVPDGVVSNLGAGAADQSTVAVAMATSGALRVIVDGIPDRLPSGLWCYRISSRRSIVGGAINDVGRCLTWLDSAVRLPEGVSIDEIAGRAPEEQTPLMLPFLTGERATGWRGDARALIAQVGLADDGASIARATLEGVALSLQRIHAQLRTVNASATRVVASGRVSGDVPHLIDLVAGAFALPVTHVPIPRTTLHGTALLTLDAIAPDVDRAPLPAGRSAEPQHTDYFAVRAEAFEELYGQMYGAPGGA